MRTDAKIGFAIGGVLLAVLTVYAIVVPKHKKTAANTVTLVTPPAQVIPTETAPVTPPMSAAGDANAQTAKDVVTPPPVAPTPAPVPPIAANTGASDEGIFHPAKPMEMTRSDDQKPTGPVIDQTPLADNLPHGPKAPRSSKTHSTEQAVADNVTAPADTHPYLIKRGQTLSSIATEVYGNSHFWIAIQRQNKGLDANHLKVGSKIILPDITPLSPGPIATVSSDEEVAPAMTASSTVVKDAHSYSYTVKSGDSLYGISKKLFGTGRKAEALYAMNKDRIGPDKARLKLGMVLKLPESASMASAAR